MKNIKIFILLFPVIIFGCATRSGIDQGFIKVPDVAVISAGQRKLPLIVSDPCVLKDDMGYHLFYTTPFCGKDSIYNYTWWNPISYFSCTTMDMTYSVGYAFSSDKGITWEFRPTPVILTGNSNWENRKIETPNVVKVEDKLYLFYCADGNSELIQRFQIGVASLYLGEKSIYDKLMIERTMFDRNGRTTPLISKNPIGFFDMNVQEPSVIYRNNSFEVYYVGLELKEDIPLNNETGLDILIDIGMGKAVFNKNLELISRTVEPILTGVNMIEMKYFNNIYCLFFTTSGNGEFHKNEKIAYSVSKDSENSWSKPTVILTKSDANTFDNWGIMAPSVVFDEDKIYLFYTALGVKDISCFGESKTRWGSPIDNNSKLGYMTLGRAIRPFFSN
ncbi:MAG: glycoside hydrolase family protein [Planctomycetota bacterium]|jgi:predicted GH43/DUF377 family glycosyl hydrolase